jgi:hypothetical protein
MTPATQSVDAVNYILWHGECGQVIPSKLAPTRQAHEIATTALAVASGPESDCTRGPGLHGIIVVFVSLYVGPKLKTAVLRVILESIGWNKLRHLAGTYSAKKHKP